MTSPHSKKLVIPRDDLAQIAETRMLEADKLFELNLFAGSMFLGGSALECYLKLAICHTLKLDGLPGVFKTHNLEALILYTGFQRDLRSDSRIRDAFDYIVNQWGDDGRKELFYAAPTEFDRIRAEMFLSHLCDPQHGVIPWLKNRLS